jgi:glycine/D-amino acid oxidase-like deaminating enzyme
MSADHKTRVLILGGGFAGLHAAIHLDATLARDPNVEITLINRDNFFRLLPCWQRTTNRPKAIFGLARAAQAMGDNATAMERYREFLSIWKDADPDRPEVSTAKELTTFSSTSLLI